MMKNFNYLFQFSSILIIIIYFFFPYFPKTYLVIAGTQEGSLHLWDMRERERESASSNKGKERLVSAKKRKKWNEKKRNEKKWKEKKMKEKKKKK